jgi:hypothetical protein
MKYAVINNDGTVAGFYSEDIHTHIPEEAVEITDAEWQAYLSNPQIKRFINNKLTDRKISLEELKVGKLGSLNSLKREKLRTDDDEDFLKLAQEELTKNPNRVIKKAKSGKLNKADVDKELDKIRDRKIKIYNREAELYEQIMNATSEAELKLIDLEEGW